jgi:hypothetical protein
MRAGERMQESTIVTEEKIDCCWLLAGSFGIFGDACGSITAVLNKISN